MFKPKTYRIPQKVKVRKKGIFGYHYVEEEQMVEVDRKTYEAWKKKQEEEEEEELWDMGFYDED